MYVNARALESFWGSIELNGEASTIGTCLAKSTNGCKRSTMTLHRFVFALKQFSPSGCKTIRPLTAYILFIAIEVFMRTDAY